MELIRWRSYSQEE